MGLKRALAVVAAATAFLAGPSPAAAMPDILPLAEVEEGMVGTLYTVVDSSGEISSFDAQILGTMNVSDRLYIVARSDGPFADTTGGLVQGMSGSPVYVDGRLIGGASMTLTGMDPHTFLITPIETMLAIWDYPDTKNQTRPETVDLKKVAEERAQKEKEAAEKAAKEKDKETGKDEAGKDATPTPEKTLEDTAEKASDDTPDKASENAADKTAATAGPEKGGDKSEKPPAEPGDGSGQTPPPAEKPPAADKVPQKPAYPSVGQEPEYKDTLYASGFQGPAMDFLRKTLAPLGFNAEPTFSGQGGAYVTDYDATLEPGAPVGAAVIFGDFSLAATGTVTAVDEGRVLAFGHQFLRRGNVNYFMTDATVFGMVTGPTDGRKITRNNRIIGRINQDRMAGIGGMLGTFPTVVPIRLTVEDKTLGCSDSYAASMAYDENLLPALSNAISYAGLDRTTDQLAQSTVRVDFAIRTNAVDGGTVERANMFYAPSDVGQVAFSDLVQAMGLICTDTDQENDILDIKVNVVSETERRTATLLTAVPEPASVKPGETVNFKVTLKPFRAENVTLTVPFTVPRRQHSGAMHLNIHGGGLVSVEQLLAALQSDMGLQESTKSGATMKTTADRLQELMEAPANNEIVIEPGGGPVPSEKEQEAAIREAIRRQQELEEAGEAAPSKDEKTGPTKFATDYVIENSIHAVLDIQRP
ncbi:MAG: SpoIVB peptidase S55 domain protein [Schwartzia sp.]|nr:SpoIVB peptidase S55 domain protein [Schwartzia sp. (in: firmicutes)]